MLKEHLVSNGFLWGPEHSPYGVAGFMTYGPMGKALKTNMEQQFREVFIDEGFDEIETPVLYPRKAWEASGHLQKFNDEMFQTQTSDGQALMGRGELATTIYPLFRRLLEYYRGNLPFRVFQSGIVLPNDRQTEWQTRTRQYTGHEGHIFMQTKDVDVAATVDYLQHLSYVLMNSVGIKEGSMNFREKIESDKPFYANKAFGLYVPDEDGNEMELLGIQYRSSYDFKRHSLATGTKLEVNGKYPEVFEISFSSDRPFYIALGQALEKIGDRVVLHLPERLAPVQGMVFPLKKTPELHNMSILVSELLKEYGIRTPILETGSIGSRYRKADGIGVPYVFTADEEGVKNDSVTIRQRDSRLQISMYLDDIRTFLENASRAIPSNELMGKLFETGQVNTDLWK